MLLSIYWGLWIKCQSLRIAWTPFYKYHHFYIMSSSPGKFPELSDATHCRIQVVENKHSKLKSKEWGARLIDCSGNDAVIEVIFPTTCAIGEYELTVETKTVLKNKTTILTHKHPDFIYVLFNPWCKGTEKPCLKRPLIQRPNNGFQDQNIA